MTEETFHLEQALDEINEIIKKLQDKEIPLEDSFALYKKGMELLTLCNAHVEHVEKQLKIIAGEGEEAWEVSTD